MICYHALYGSGIVAAGVWDLQGTSPAAYNSAVGGRQPRGPRPVFLDRVLTSDTKTLTRVVESGRQGEHKEPCYG